MEFNSLIPELSVTDIKKSRSFYVDILGFVIEYLRDEDKFIFLSFEKSQLMIQEMNGNWNTGRMDVPFGRGINLQIDIKDAKALHSKLVSLGYPIFSYLEDHWYRMDDILLGCREFLVQDPDGYLLRFSEDLGEKKA